MSRRFFGKIKVSKENLLNGANREKRSNFFARLYFNRFCVKIIF